MSFADVDRGNNRSYQGGGGFGNRGGGYGDNGGGGFGNRGGGGGGDDPLVASIKDNIRQLSSNVGTISKFCNMLGTNKDTVDIRERLASSIENTKAIVKNAHSQLEELGSKARSSEQTKLVHQKLQRDYATGVESYRDLVKTVAQKEKMLPPPKKQQQQQDSYSRGGYDEEEPFDEKASLLAAEESRRQQQFYQVDNEREHNEQLINDRDEGIRQIEATVVEVNSLFMDLSNIVQQQGVMIDNIESNIEETSHHATEGVTADESK
eukprot:TRINITY_DN4920_c0_g1_i1.p1 TRINITY_DN4920_c0_g1~~TRINITY_DN4920_c0_g1_i1.p1  ORF type:complete len:265 (+),score=48.28 TRINITY_DN4920_c0_g1_i1:65-859(+)